MADKTSPASDRPAARARRREKPEQIADELRRLIISGELDEGDSLGHEPDLVERFVAMVEQNDLDETDDRLRIDSLAALRASSRR